MIKKLNQKKMIRTYPKVYSRGQRDASTGWMERRGDGGECFKNFLLGLGGCQEYSCWMIVILVEMHHLAGWRPRFFLLDVHMRQLQ